MKPKLPDIAHPAPRPVRADLACLVRLVCLTGFLVRNRPATSHAKDPARSVRAGDRR